MPVLRSGVIRGASLCTAFCRNYPNPFNRGALPRPRMGGIPCCGGFADRRGGCYFGYGCRLHRPGFDREEGI